MVSYIIIYNMDKWLYFEIIMYDFQLEMYYQMMSLEGVTKFVFLMLQLYWVTRWRRKYFTSWKHMIIVVIF